MFPFTKEEKPLKLRALLCLLCALMLACPVLAQGENAKEQAIEPAYAVPDYVAWLLDTARDELGYT